MQGGTLNLSDEAAGVGNVISSALGGDFNVGENYRFGRDVERQRIADARQQLGYGAGALEFLGGAASAAPGKAVELTRGALAAAGATGGALAGFGQGEGTDESLAGAGVGGAAGGALAVAAPAIVNRVLPRRLRPSPALNT